MYEEFFGFSRRPFSLTPDPEFLFWTDQHRRAFDLVCMSLMRHAPIAVVTGEVGAGKTTLIQELLREISDDFEVALLSNVVGDSGDLLRWILTAFGEESEPSSRAEALREVEGFLRDVSAAGRRSVLIVDEAQNVSDSGIETLRLLTNVDVGKAAPLSLVLAGQPQLRDRLRGPRFAAFRQRLGASSHLGPMTLAETTGYVRSRLTVAGGDPDVFADGAIEAVHRRALGVPRLTNLLCDVCLVSAYGEDRLYVDAAFAESTLAESLAIGGLGGLAAEAAEVEDAVAETAAARNAAVPLLKVARVPARSAASEPLSSGTQRRAPAPPDLRLISGGAPPFSGGDAGEDALPLVPPARDEGEPLRFGALPSDAAPEPPAQRHRPVAWSASAWRRGLGSVAGAAVAASLAGSALIVAASWTDAAQAISDVATLLTEPADAMIAPVVPPTAASEVAGATASPAASADGALGIPEARIAEADPQGAERLFRAALDNAAIDPASAAVDYARAAARGHGRAAYYLAQMYETGDGVVLAPDSALAWYAVAADDVRGAEDRMAEVAIYPGPEVGFATPLFSAVGNGTVELVWEGRGTFVVELAAAPDDMPTAIHSTPLTAVRLEAPQDVAWWRVRAIEAEPSPWRPIDPTSALSRK